VPSSFCVVAAQQRRHVLFFVRFWFNSLELTINNEMLVLFFVEGWNG
jgi:hypothetical protein